MQPANKNTPRDNKDGQQKPSNPVENVRNNGSARNKLRAAHLEALRDIEQDADLSFHSPNDYLDEGETARLGEEKTDLI
jgi:hypothetical protein